MLIARSRPPLIRTSPTPGLRSSCCRMTLSASSVNSRTGRSLISAMEIEGFWSLLLFVIVGGSASGGNKRITVATRSRTS